MVSYPRYLPVAPRQHASWCASPANQPAYACSPVKRWLLAMLRMPAVPLRAFDRLRARRPPRAGRDAGTGALNRTQELTLRESAAAFITLYGPGPKHARHRLRRHLYALPGSRLHADQGQLGGLLKLLLSHCRHGRPDVWGG